MARPKSDKPKRKAGVWVEALKEWNKSRGGMWCVPGKDSEEIKEVRKIMERMKSEAKPETKPDIPKPEAEPMKPTAEEASESAIKALSKLKAEEASEAGKSRLKKMFEEIRAKSLSEAILRDAMREVKEERKDFNDIFKKAKDDLLKESKARLKKKLTMDQAKKVNQELKDLFIKKTLDKVSDDLFKSVLSDAMREISDDIKKKDASRIAKEASDKIITRNNERIIREALLAMAQEAVRKAEIPVEDSDVIEMKELSPRREEQEEKVNPKISSGLRAPKPKRGPKTMKDKLREKIKQTEALDAEVSKAKKQAREEMYVDFTADKK